MQLLVDTETIENKRVAINNVIDAITYGIQSDAMAGVETLQHNGEGLLRLLCVDNDRDSVDTIAFDAYGGDAIAHNKENIKNNTKNKQNTQKTNNTEANDAKECVAKNIATGVQPCTEEKFPADPVNNDVLVATQLAGVITAGVQEYVEHKAVIDTIPKDFFDEYNVRDALDTKGVENDHVPTSQSIQAVDPKASAVVHNTTVQASHTASALSKEAINDQQTIHNNILHHGVGLCNTSSTALKTTGEEEGSQSVKPALEKQYLGCTIGNEEWLIPITAVARITMEDADAIMPQYDPYLVGVMDTEEGVVPIIDAMRLFTGSDCCIRFAKKNIIVICVWEKAYLGIFVHGTTQIYTITTMQEHNTEGVKLILHEATMHTEYPFVSSIVLENDTMLPVIDIASIFKKYT